MQTASRCTGWVSSGMLVWVPSIGNGMFPAAQLLPGIAWFLSPSSWLGLGETCCLTGAPAGIITQTLVLLPAVHPSYCFRSGQVCGEHILALMHDLHPTETDTDIPLMGTRRKHWHLMSKRTQGHPWVWRRVVLTTVVVSPVQTQTTACYQLSLKSPYRRRRRKAASASVAPLTSEILSVLGFHWGLPISTGCLSYICSLLFP